MAREAGATKRVAAPKKAIPTRKAASIDEKTALADQVQRDKVFSGEASQEEQQAFLRSMVSGHFE